MRLFRFGDHRNPAQPQGHSAGLLPAAKLSPPSTLGACSQLENANRK